MVWSAYWTLRETLHWPKDVTHHDRGQPLHVNDLIKQSLGRGLAGGILVSIARNTVEALCPAVGFDSGL